jgi:radical SAM-linked protein
MDAPDQVHQKQKWLKEEARREKVDLRTHDCDTSWLEGVFARGDRPLGQVVERAFRNGARFDSWEETKKLGVWEEAFQAFGIEPGKYLGTIPVTARLPWDHIDVGLEDGFLLREYRKALKSRLSVPCGKVAGTFVHATNLEDAETDKRKLVCYDCGVACDLSAMREERLIALRKLGAEKPREPAPPPVKRLEPTKRPIKIEQGAARRYRFQYAKLGPSALLSHIDLIRALPRAFRRLEIPLFYSSGFHPKPDMSFGPALSLGIYSLAELIDMKITADIDPAEHLEQLTQGAHGGIEFLGAVRLGEGDAGVNRVIDAARYVVGIPKDVALDIDRVLEAESLPIVRRIDGIGKKVDVKTFLRGITRGGHQVLERAGIVGDLQALTVDVKITGSGAVKISEVMEVLGDVPFRAVRAEMGTWHEGRIVSPLELETLKSLRRLAAENVEVDHPAVGAGDADLATA